MADVINERDWKEKLSDKEEEVELAVKAKAKKVSNDVKDTAEKAQRDIKKKLGK